MTITLGNSGRDEQIQSKKRHALACRETVLCPVTKSDRVMVYSGFESTKLGVASYGGEVLDDRWVAWLCVGMRFGLWLRLMWL